MQGASRDTAFDTLCASIGTALAADRTLGGICDWAEAEAPRPVDLPVEGAASLKAAVIPVLLHYSMSDQLARPEPPRFLRRPQSEYGWSLWKKTRERTATCLRAGFKSPAMMSGGCWMSSLMVQLQSSWLLCPPSGPISWTPSQASENVRILFDQALRPANERSGWFWRMKEVMRTGRLRSGRLPRRADAAGRACAAG